jgi:hypothetical protein
VTTERKKSGESGGAQPSKDADMSGTTLNDVAQIACDDPVGVADAVGRQIRSSYEVLLKAPVPDRFAKLLRQLEASEKDKGGEA